MIKWLRQMLYHSTPPVHQHEFYMLCVVDGHRILECNCGARLRMVHATDGEGSVVIPSGPTSLDNVLINVTQGG